MRLASILAATVALGGCASTVTEYRAQPAAVQFETSKTPEEALRCLAAGFEAMGDAPNVMASSVGQTLSWRGSTRQFVDIVPAGAGAKVAYHQHGVIDAGTRYADVVNRCRD